MTWCGLITPVTPITSLYLFRSRLYLLLSHSVMAFVLIVPIRNICSSQSYEVIPLLGAQGYTFLMSHSVMTIVMYIVLVKAMGSFLCFNRTSKGSLLLSCTSIDLDNLQGHSFVLVELSRSNLLFKVMHCSRPSIVIVESHRLHYLHCCASVKR